MTAETRSAWAAAVRGPLLAPAHLGCTARVRAGTAFKPSPDVVAAAAAAAGATADAAVLERTSPPAGGGAAAARGAPQPPAPPQLGYEKGWAEKYRVVQELGRGGNGIVTLVLDLQVRPVPAPDFFAGTSAPAFCQHAPTRRAAREARQAGPALPALAPDGRGGSALPRAGPGPDAPAMGPGSYSRWARTSAACFAANQ